MSVPTEYLAIAAVALSGSFVSVSASKVVLNAITPPAIEALDVVAPDAVRAGDVVTIRWTLVKRTKCPGVAGRVWVGEDGFYLSETRRSTGLPMSIEPVTYNIETHIPQGAPTGHLSLQIVGAYHCKGKPEVPFVLGPVEMEVVE